MEGIIYKGLEAWKVESNMLSIIVVPELGGKIASIFRKDKDFELLFQSKDKDYVKPSIYSDFSNFDAAGFDDAFPTIDSCDVKLGKDVVRYPDHGEIWCSKLEYKAYKESICLYYNSRIIPCTYRKLVKLKEDKLIIDYSIKNNSLLNIPFIWAMHCLVRYEEDMKLILPENTDLVENVLKSERLGVVGDLHIFPKSRVAGGKEIRLDKMAGLKNNMEKFYVYGSVAKGECGIHYPSNDICFKILYDANKLPYLGFWVTEGGFRGDYNCALEPATSYYDSVNIAQRKKCLSFLKPNELFTFSITIELY